MDPLDQPTAGWASDFAPLDRDLPFEPDPVIEAYTRHIDRTLLRENLRTTAERFENLERWQRFAAEAATRRDEDTLRRGLNFTLTTTRGDVDLLGEITGGERYEELLPHSVALEIFGVASRCLNLEKLIAVKRAAGRPKDLEAVAEIEAIWEERRKLGL